MYVELKRAEPNDEVAFISGPIVMTKGVEGGLVVMIDVSERWFDNQFKQVFLNQRTSEALAKRLEPGRYMNAFCRIWKRKVKGNEVMQYFGLKCDIFPRESSESTPPAAPDAKDATDAAATIPFRPLQERARRRKPKLPEDVPVSLIQTRVQPPIDVHQASDDEILRTLSAETSM